MNIISDNKRMGKGLDALFNKPVSSPQPQDQKFIVEVNLDVIKPNPYQPRKEFNKEQIAELAASIKEQGLLQPITLRRQEDRFEIVSGERRFRAYSILGESQIPAYIIDDLNDERMLELALIENIQREDLNPLELSNSYHQLVETCGLTQEEIAQKVGKNRSSVANFMRLKRLPLLIREGLEKNLITFGHAKVILGLERVDLMEQLFQIVIQKDLTVRKTEEIAKNIGLDRPVYVEQKPNIDQVFITESEKILTQRALGCPVRIKVGKDSKGSIVIKFANSDELKKLIETLNQ